MKKRQAKKARGKAEPSRPEPPHVYFEHRDALRAWLAEHHRTHPAIWLVYDKQRGPGQRALTYDAIVEEALCFGWIDSVSGSVSASRAKLYFSPRKKGSAWSALNKRRIERLEQEGKIEAHGRALIDAAKADGSWTALDSVEALEVPRELASALARKGCRKVFDSMPPGKRKQFLAFLAGAKREETKQARLEKCVALISAGKRLDGSKQPAK